MLSFLILYKVKYMKFNDLIEMITTDATPNTDATFPVYRFPLVTKAIRRKMKRGVMKG